MRILIILSNILLAFYLDPLNPLHERIIKGYTLLLTETYGLKDGKKTNIASTLTVNGSVINATEGYEFDTIEPKKFGGNTYIVANLYNQSGDTYSLVINSSGNVVYK